MDKAKASGEPDRYTAQSVELAFKLLETFDHDAGEVSLSEFAERLAVTRSAVFRLVHTLNNLGYLERVGDSKYYRLGPRVMSLGFSYLASKGIIELARPELERLRSVTHCTTHLGILEGSEVVYLAHYIAYKPMSTVVALGARVPAHATTMGQAMLAYKSKDYIEEHFGGRALDAFSDRTPRSLDDLFAVLAVIRSRGYVVSHSNFEVGIASIGVPLFNAQSEIEGAISVATTESTIASDDFDEKIRDATIAAAGKISTLLGFIGSLARR